MNSKNLEKILRYEGLTILLTVLNGLKTNYFLLLKTIFA